MDDHSGFKYYFWKRNRITRTLYLEWKIVWHQRYIFRGALVLEVISDALHTILICVYCPCVYIPHVYDQTQPWFICIDNSWSVNNVHCKITIFVKFMYCLSILPTAGGPPWVISIFVMWFKHALMRWHARQIILPVFLTAIWHRWDLTWDFQLWKMRRPTTLIFYCADLLAMWFCKSLGSDRALCMHTVVLGECIVFLGGNYLSPKYSLLLMRRLFLGIWWVWYGGALVMHILSACMNHGTSWIIPL